MSSMLLCLLFRFRCSTFFDKKTFVRINSWPLYYNFRLGCAIIAAATDSIRTIVLIVTLESPISLQAAVFSHPCLSTGSASLLRRNNLYVKSFSQYSRRQFCRHYRSLYKVVYVLKCCFLLIVMSLAKWTASISVLK